MVEQLGGVLSAAVSDALKSRDRLSGGVPSAEAGSFMDAMSNALKSVNEASQKADDLGKRLQLDDPTASVEATVLASNIASLQFTGLVQARNKILQAYNDVMNMSV
jgi:flagellar hook-basal body complex protein FliE